MDLVVFVLYGKIARRPGSFAHGFTVHTGQQRGTRRYNTALTNAANQQQSHMTVTAPDVISS